MRGTKVLLAVASSLLLLLWLGCAGPSQERGTDTDTQTTDQQTDGQNVGLGAQTYVDVYAYGGDDWREPWSPDIKPAARFKLTTQKTRSDTGIAEDLRMVQGFRLQLADVLEHAQATEIQDRALPLLDYVYVTFRSPNYKVRAGNYKTRAEAEKKLQIARTNGFRDAWIVPDWVYENPPPPEPTLADSLATDSLRVQLNPDAVSGD